MVFGFVSSMIMAAALGQSAPAEGAAWLKSVPADADAIVYLRGVRPVKDDLLAMVRAMSPTLAQQIEPAIEQGLQQMAQQVPDEVTTSPVLVALKLPEPDAPGEAPPLAIFAKVSDVDALIKSFAQGQEAKPEKVAGGYEKVSARGEDLFLFRGDGFVAIAPTDEMIRQIAAKPGATADAKLSADLKRTLFAGDLGGYISLVAVQNQYGDQIDQARQALMAAMDQAAGQMQAGQIEQAKELYGNLFDSIKQGDAFVLNVDFAADALDVTGLITVKPGTEAAKSLADAKSTPAAKLGNLPADSLMYTYLNVDPTNFAALNRMNMANLGGQAGDSPEMKKAMEAMKAAGRQEAYGAVRFGDQGMEMVQVAYPENAKATIESSKEMVEAMGKSEILKDVKIEENAQTYEGLTFTKTSATFDLDKLTEQAGGQPAAAQTIKAMFGGDTFTTWYGTDGEKVVTVTGPDFEAAKPRIDAALSGQGGIGQTAGFKAIRGKLPEQVTAIFLVQSQELVKSIAGLLKTIAGADMPAPAGMPKEPALFGGSITASPGGYRFDFVLPSGNGPVFEKGFAPLIQGLQGQINQ